MGPESFPPSKTHELQHSAPTHTFNTDSKLCAYCRYNSEISQITTAACDFQTNGQSSAQLAIKIKKIKNPKQPNKKKA